MTEDVTKHFLNTLSELKFSSPIWKDVVEVSDTTKDAQRFLLVTKASITTCSKIIF
ncbi:MAG: hypothetical protein JWR87_2155 [Segetibacter sp.]|nr:hypothetical protein [Segetibacter sp.]